MEKFYFSKWLTYSAACLVMSSAGLAYTFSVYSDSIKDRFGYSQTRLAGLGTAGNIGGYLSVFSGLFYDWVKPFDRLGPVMTLCIGVLMQTSGNLLLYLAVKGMIMPPYVVMLLIAAMSCNSQTWFEVASMVTCVRNFETERGTVIGILKALLGLSASIYTTLYVAFLEPDEPKFLLMLAIGPSLIALCVAPFINFVPFIQVEPHTKSHAFHMSLTAVVGLALFQGVAALVRQEAPLDLWGGVLVASAVVILILPICAVPWVFGGTRARPLDSERHPPPAKGAGDEQQPLLPQLGGDQSSPPAMDMDARLEDVYRVKGPIKCLSSQSFWLLLFINGVGTGCGLTLLNNLGQQVASLDSHEVGHSSQAVFVSAFSVANCFGRLCAGFIPDRAMRHYGTSRILWLVLLSALTLGACLLNAFTRMRYMGLACAASGLVFGGFQGLVPAVTSELFGMAHFATNYSLQQLGPAAGSTLLATWLAGTVYERAAGKQGQQVCKGPGCFRLTYLVEAGLAGAAFVAAVVLWRRCQHLHDRVAAVTRDERGRRGLQGAQQEARQVIARVAAHNEHLQDLMQQSYNLVEGLHDASAEDEGGPRAAADQLEGLLGEARSLLQEHHQAYLKYQGLSPNHRFRK